MDKTCFLYSLKLSLYIGSIEGPQNILFLESPSQQVLNTRTTVENNFWYLRSVKVFFRDLGHSFDITSKNV